MKNVCKDYSLNLVLFIHSDFVVITPESCKTNFHESQYDGWSSRMPTILPIYAKHVGCILRLLNCTELLRVNQAKEIVAVCV